MGPPTLFRTPTFTRALGDGTIAIDVPLSDTQTHEAASISSDGSVRSETRLDTKFRKRQKRYERPSHTFAGVPRMDIAILITGSRGDVQPFIALGKLLQAAPYHHRIRIGTHSVFRSFVLAHDLEFFSIGGDPARLMSYMVRNPGILPSMATIRAGEIGERKADLEDMLMGAWRACTETSESVRPGEGGEDGLLRPFVADCIISNPPTFGSLHIAERLSVPLHMMFTMPWSPTTAFPHPLARLEFDRHDTAKLNYVSYMQIELLTWLGLVDIINHFRRHTLLLDPIDPARGTTLMTRLKVPHTYIWSPSLVAKPPDWGDHISICGFSFLSLASQYEPGPKLKSFLAAGGPPIYVGFGSVVVEDPDAMSRLIFDAVRKAGVRALVSKGWSNFAEVEESQDVFLLDDVPHDWLFQHVSAVVHHGGAGTCAIGLALGKPTVIVPFFGDQFWWANMVYRSGAGPAALPYKTLTADHLSKSIIRALQPDMRVKAAILAEQIQKEDGAKSAAEQFHKMQDMQRFSCFLCPDRVAVWRVRHSNIQLSLLAVAVLFKRKLLKPADVKLVRQKRWYVEEGAYEPISGMIAAALITMVAVGSDMQDCKRLASRGSADCKKGDLLDCKKPWNLDEQTVGMQTEHTDPAYPYAQLAKRLAADVGTAPVNLLFNIANGFHNLPAYALNDDTVRERQRVTGVVSGLAVAGKEIVFGVYDSIAGIAIHPYKGFVRGHNRRGGPFWGATKGCCRSVGGMFCRTGAIIFALPGYGLKGVEQQLLRSGHKPDRLPELSNDLMDRAYKGLLEERPEMRRRAMRDEWMKLTASQPLFQRRVMQTFLDLEEMLEKCPSKEGDILREWNRLVGAESAA